MSHVVKKLIFVIGIIVITVSCEPINESDHGHTSLWQLADPSVAQRSQGDHRHQVYFTSDDALLRKLLENAPSESSADSSYILELPLPDSSISRFSLIESPVMAPELAAKFPQLKTYKVYGLDDPTASGRVDISPDGLRAMLNTSKGRVTIDPEGARYRVRKQGAGDNAEAFKCSTPGHEHAAHAHSDQIFANRRLAQRIPGNLQVYRLAVSATAEYVAALGGTDAMTEIMTAVNRVNQIYERDLGIKLVLVANNDQLIDANGTSPLAGLNNNGSLLLDANQTWIDTKLGTENYDIGHVFSTGGGGIASVGSVCSSTRKAQGVTGLPNPTGETFYIDFVAHEIGHQFSARHTFNGTTGSCASTARNATTAYEPGSGTTIMSYAGICGSENVQVSSDAHFHSESISAINGFTNFSATCNTLTSANNPNEPTANAGTNFTVPVGTPFQLTGTGSDLDSGDTLTYQWDQVDRGTATSESTLGQDLGDNPLFRSYGPHNIASRDFPALGTQVQGLIDKSEVLPCSSRILDFELTVRDNKTGQNSDRMRLIVDDTSGPFKVTSHTTPATIVNGTGAVDITWDVANTSNAPLNCATVDIDLLTFAPAYESHSVTPLLSATANDGVESVIIPDSSNDLARFRVKCSTGIFYDISDADLVIQGSGVFPTDGNQTFFNSNGTAFTTTAPECVASPPPPDLTPPVVTAPANITVAATDASGTARSAAAIQSFLNAATANDAVDGPIASVTNNAPLQFPLGITTVTFSATDSASNTGTAQATVNVTDQTAPVITLTGAASIALNVGQSFSDPGSTVTDNVDVGLTATVTGSVNTSTPGLYTLTYNVSDAANNAATPVTRNITVQDNVAPVVTAPANITVAATDASGTARSAAAIQSFLNAATANDAVDGPIASVTNNAPLQFPLGITTVTFSATDSASNTGTAQATVTVTDQTAPVITLTGAASITLNVGDVFTDPGSTVTDNVDVGLTATVTGSVNTSTPWLYTLTYNVSDAANNAATPVTRSITVQDNVAPVVTAPANITVAATDASGTAPSAAAIQSFLNAATANDAVDGPIASVTNNAPLQFPLGITTVTFSATDSASNTGTAQATVTVTDQTAPVITLIGASSITLNVGQSFTDPGSTVTDNVDVGLTAIVTGSVNTTTPGPYTLSYNVSDSAGNPALTVTRSITVQDAAAPVVTPPANITVAATDASGTARTNAAIATFLSGASATDDVDTTLTISHDAPLQFPLGITTVTFSATDSASNTGTAQATVTVTDQTAPVITLTGAASITLNVGDVFTDPGSTVTDNVDVGLTAIVTGSVNTSTPGLYTLTYNVSDAANNAATPVTRSITVQDNVAPVVTAPANITVAATDASGTARTNAAIATFLSGASATDDVDTTLTISHDAPLQFPLGITTVTFSATDSASNTGTAQATVTVTDQTAPVITLTGAASITLNVGDVFTDPGSTVTDNVDVGLTAIVTGSVNTSTPGLYTLTYNVSDAANNAATPVTRSITVQDNVAPVVTAPANITVAATDASGTARSAAAIQSFLNAATANDAVDGPIASVTNNAPLQFPLGITTVTFSATDLSGNTGQAQATVNVTDQTAPVITLTGASSITLSVGQSFSDPGSTVSDNVDVGLTAVVTGTVNTNAVGLYTLTYNVSDAANNAATPVTRSITVQDNVAPVVTAPANITVAATDASGTARSAAAIQSFLNAATANDAVDGPIASVTNNAPLQFPLGITTVTFSATDSASNTGTAQATVNVTDQTAPVITLTGANTVNVEQGGSYVDAGATAIDNIDGAVGVLTINPVNVNVTGTYTVTYDASDAAGNIAVQVTRTVIVADTSEPIITLLGAAIVNVEQGGVYNDAGATAVDNIDGSLTVSTVNPVNVNVAGTYTVTYNATDSSGNAAAQVTRTVIVADTIAPVITLNGTASVNVELGSPYSDAGANAVDNTDGAVNVSTVNPVNVNVAGTYTVTYDAIDAAGNTATRVARTVIVADTIAPVITLKGAASVNVELGGAYIDAGANAVDNTDGTVSVSTVNTVNVNVAGTYIVTYDAIDTAGNAATRVTRTVIVADTIAPVITLNGAVSVNVELGSTYNDAGASAVDNIDGAVSVVTSNTVNANIPGTYTIIYNATDAAGNAATQVVRSVIVADTIAPIITLTGPATVNVELASPYNDAGASATDNTDGTIAVIVNSLVNVNVAGTYTVTYDAIDAAGNAAAQVTRTVIVADTTAPVISLVGATSVNVEQGSPYNDAGASAVDAIDGTVAVTTINPVNSDIAGTYTVTYDAIDTAGNASTRVTRTVIVADTTAPVITLTGSATVNVEQGGVYADAGATAVDNFDGPLTVTISNPINVNVAGTYTITYNASDAAGNAAIQRIRTVIVADTISPVITLVGASSLTLNVGDVFSDPGSTVTDNVDAGLSATVTGSVNTSTPGLYTLSYNASDSAGNGAVTVTRSISVQDSAAPVVTPPASITVAATNAAGTARADAAIGAFLAAATASDAVDGPIALVTNDAPAQFPLGITTVTFSATDTSGNTGQAQATVTVQDQAAPVITLTGNGSVNVEQGTPYNDAGATATDNIDGTITVNTVIPVNVNVADTYTVTYNASDAAGNSAAEVTRTVIVSDTTAPVITLTGSATVNVELGDAYSDAGATATDAIDGAVAVNSINPVNVNIAGTYSVTYDASDTAGNAAIQVTRTVIVADTTKPVITLLGAATVNVEQGSVYNDAGATISDNSSGSIALVTANPVNVNTAGTYSVTYDATDAAGNTALQVIRTVIVADTTNPVITLNGATSVNVEQGTSYSDAGAIATDNIDGALTVTTSNPVNVNLAGTYTVTYDASDTAGNDAAQVTRTVIVADTIAPVITLLGASSITLNVGDIFTDPGSTVTDNVDVGLTAVVTGTVNTNAVGLYTLTYNVSDSANNAATPVTRSITVQDGSAPVVTPPANIIVAATDATGTARTVAAIDAFLGAANANDAVDGPIASVTNNAPLQFPLGITTVTFSATDLSGNTGTAQATVNVTDQTAPVITLTGAASITLNVGDIFTDPGSTVTDNVDIGLSASVSGSVDTNTPGLYTLTYNVSDAANNAATPVTRSITVQDSAAPVVTPPASITVAATDATGTARAVAEIQSFLGAATADDAVDGPIASVTNNAPVQFPLGLTTVTFSATDTSGNTGQAQATVNVTDQTAPVITLLGASSITLSVGQSFSDPGSTVTDNVDVGLSASVSGSVNTNSVGLYTLTYNVSDAANNAATQVTRSVTVQDSAAPVVTPPVSITVAATDATGTARSAAAIQSFLNAATANDSVDGAIASVTNNAPVQFPLGLTTVTFRATDTSGNTGQAQATVNVTDQAAPVITLTGAASITLSVGQSFTDPGSTVADNVDSSLTATVTGTVNTGSAGFYTLTYNATDNAGNRAVTITRTITVQDSAAPVVIPPGNIIVAATDASGTSRTVAAIVSFLGATTASDLVDGPINLVTNNAPSLFPLGLTTVTFSATDTSGNTGQAQATVTVTDQSAPLITLLGASSITLNVGQSFTDPGSTVTDNVDVGLSATVTGSVDTTTVGLYTLLYNVFDAAGNAATPVTRSITVQDSTAPVVTAPANITVAATDSTGNARSATAIQSFLNAATANDAVDGPIASVTNNAPLQFPLGITTVTFSATDLSGNTGQAQATVNVTDQTAPVITLTGASSITLNVGQSFTDPGSTVSDNVDVGLTAIVTGTVNTTTVGLYTLTYNVSDAANNAATQVTRTVNVTADATSPVVTAPADIVIPSQGAVTSVALGNASAFDDVDGVIAALPDNSGPFASGHHQILWSSTDSAGNTGFDIQFVDVQPLIEFQLDQLSEPGQLVPVRVFLNGSAASYPVTVDYEILDNNTGQAATGRLSIDAGIEGGFDYRVADSIQSGDITFRITNVVNAVMGAVTTHTISVINENVTPQVSLGISQNGNPTHLISADSGPVIINAFVQDTNALGNHRYDWSLTDNALLALSTESSDSGLIIDPVSLTPGLYTINVRVTDDGMPNLSTVSERHIKVVDSAPLLTRQDSDDDGVADIDEGYGDRDSDGIPDYLDAIDNVSLIQSKAGVTDKWLMNVQSGLRLTLGKLAFAANQNSANIGENTLTQLFDSFGGVNSTTGNEGYSNEGGLFDFEIQGLTRDGQSVAVVIPLLSAVPAQAIYRKYSDSNGWSNFVENGSNELSSAAGQEGVCPAPGDPAFTAGLTQGHYCVQLLIEDGGPNDADNSRNFVIRDPGGIFITTPAPPVVPPPAPTSPQASQSSGGGGSIGLPLLLLMLSFGLLTLLIQRRESIEKKLSARID